MNYSTLPLFSLQPETKEIPLTRGMVTIVDAADFDWLNQWKWYAQKGRNTFYAARKITLPNGKSQNVIMHRVIMKAPKGISVDHRDMDGLNNTRDNLRLATNQQNHFNLGSHRDSASKYKGVSFYKRDQNWKATIMANGKGYHLGYFDSELDAARAYDTAARTLHGEFAFLNFRSE